MTLGGLVLTLLGLGLWVLYRVQAGTEAHSFTPDSVAPRTVQLTAGHQYHLSIPGGVHVEPSLGVEPSLLACTIAPTGGAAAPLSLSAEDSGSKATNQIASFVAPYSGRVHIACTGLPQVFVDDADDVGGDLSGLWLVLATISLAIGLPMTLSALRGSGRRPRPASGPAWSDSARAAGEDEEIEGLVDRARRRADDREVGDRDRGDVGP